MQQESGCAYGAHVRHEEKVLPEGVNFLKSDSSLLALTWR
jgi:hypothetical protein